MRQFAFNHFTLNFNKICLRVLGNKLNATFFPRHFKKICSAFLKLNECNNFRNNEFTNEVQHLHSVSIQWIRLCLHYLVIQEKVDESGDAFGELREFSYGFHGRALTAVKHVHANLLIGRSSVNHLIPHQPVFRLPQRVHVMNDKRLKDTKRKKSGVFTSMFICIYLLLTSLERVTGFALVFPVRMLRAFFLVMFRFFR